MWINTQKSTYRGQGTCKIIEKHIRLLEEIKIKWFNQNINDKLIQEEIDNRNKKRKEKEILNRFYSLLIMIEEKNTNIISKDDIEKINNQFVKQLNNKVV